MPPVPMEITMPGVALRKESVDRNTGTKSHDPGQVLSLSARRAWIEIWTPLTDDELEYCRSPQGERG